MVVLDGCQHRFARRLVSDVPLALRYRTRFLKQHLGLHANQSTDLHSANLWMYLCATAYYQLLLMRSAVQNELASAFPTWARHPFDLPFLLELGTPARPPKPSGKGTGRPKGYRPQPRPRYRVVRKTQKRARRHVILGYCILLKSFSAARFVSAAVLTSLKSS